ncbi:MAG: hypothetical protein ACLVI9_01535 [Anaerostipes hadrus]
MDYLALTEKPEVGEVCMMKFIDTSVRLMDGESLLRADLPMLLRN